MSLWHSANVDWLSAHNSGQPKCDRCGKETDVMYNFVWCTDVSRKLHCANCIKDKNCGQSERLYLLAKYEKHLNTLTDKEIKLILEKVK